MLSSSLPSALCITPYGADRANMHGLNNSRRQRMHATGTNDQCTLLGSDLSLVEAQPPGRPEIQGKHHHAGTGWCFPLNLRPVEPQQGRLLTDAGWARDGGARAVFFRTKHMLPGEQK